MHSKKSAFIAVFSVMTLLFNGCLVTSIHPLYFEEDNVYKPELLGTWRAKNDDFNWMFKKDDGDKYKLLIFDEKTSGEFEAHLLRLGEYLFLDIIPGETQLEMNLMYALHLQPVHSFYKVSIAGDSLALGNIEVKVFEDMVEQNKVDISYEHLNSDDNHNDSYLLTAPTKELQSFYLKCSKEDSFDTQVLVRQNDDE